MGVAFAEVTALPNPLSIALGGENDLRGEDFEGAGGIGEVVEGEIGAGSEEF